MPISIGQSHIEILLDGSVNSGHCICLFDTRGHRIRSFVHDFTHSLEQHPLNCWANHTKQRTSYAITVSIAFTCDCPSHIYTIPTVKSGLNFCHSMPKCPVCNPLISSKRTPQTTSLIGGFPYFMVGCSVVFIVLFLCPSVLYTS